MDSTFLPASQSHGAAEIDNDERFSVQAASIRSDAAGCTSGNAIAGSPRLVGQEQQQVSPSPPASPRSGSSVESLTPSLRLALWNIFGSESSSGSSDYSCKPQRPSEEPPHNSTFQQPPRSSFEYEAFSVHPASCRSDAAGCASGNTSAGSPRPVGQHEHFGDSSRFQGSNSICEHQQVSPSPPASPHSGSSAESLTPSLRLALWNIFGSESSSGSSDYSCKPQRPSEEPPHSSTFQPPPRSSFEFEAQGGGSDDLFRSGHDGILPSENCDIDESSSRDNELKHPKTTSVEVETEHIFSRVPRDDMGELTSHVPLDDKGQLTSIGSAGHYQGHCHPCVFIFTSVGCSNGAACWHCHVPHDASMIGNLGGPPRRSGRGKRRKNVEESVLRQVGENPDSVVVSDNPWPTPAMANAPAGLLPRECSRRRDVKPRAPAGLPQPECSRWLEVETNASDLPIKSVSRAANSSTNWGAAVRVSL